jgi:hypothetical protein
MNDQNGVEARTSNNGLFPDVSHRKTSQLLFMPQSHARVVLHIAVSTKNRFPL